MYAGLGAVGRLGFCTVPVSSTTPLPADVELYLLDLKRSETQLRGPFSLLSAAERARATRIIAPAARMRFVTTRAALRVLLGEKQAIDPATVSFAYGAHGKPRLACERTLTFNVSHSGELALIALAEEVAVGVDIQRIEAQRNWRDLLGAVGGPDEHRRLLAEADRRGPTVFFERWVAKEALLKAAGTGFSGVLRRDEAPYRLAPLTVPNGYAAAIALQQTLTLASATGASCSTREAARLSSNNPCSSPDRLCPMPHRLS
jgi:4'-phosphopantetheinyl transferase